MTIADAVPVFEEPAELDAFLHLLGLEEGAAADAQQEDGSLVLAIGDRGMTIERHRNIASGKPGEICLSAGSDHRPLCAAPGQIQAAALPGLCGRGSPYAHTEDCQAASHGRGSIVEFVFMPESTVRQVEFTCSRANREVPDLNYLVCSSLVSPCLRNLSFRMCHVLCNYVTDANHKAEIR